MYEENNVIDLNKFNLNRKSLIKSMADNMEYSSVEHPQIGIFWYDSDKQELFGVNKTDAEDVNFVHGYDGDIKQYKYLHKDIWAKEFRRNKDIRFVGDYTQIPRGRVCEYKDKGFVVYVDDWIDNYPEAKSEILFEFNLPETTTFVKDIHWNLGHGWSDELI